MPRVEKPQLSPSMLAKQQRQSQLKVKKAQEHGYFFIHRKQRNGQQQ
jgi:hypothetical protein